MLRVPGTCLCALRVIAGRVRASVLGPKGVHLRPGDAFVARVCCHTFRMVDVEVFAQVSHHSLGLHPEGESFALWGCFFGAVRA